MPNRQNPREAQRHPNHNIFPIALRRQPDSTVVVQFIVNEPLSMLMNFPSESQKGLSTRDRSRTNVLPGTGSR
ncbi:hypothetical protein K227x_60870 [Rubripirellula lacrimiformis]|uniref:Uncharacterized protein n=1 Tax=Rubripirellula lacrimiformis TaxID=1930273 RepID=A0A517NKQ2_9BACT|nr:hypothetical protein K227x_60870 [Rubripirellula lacrimiformis]